MKRSEQINELAAALAKAQGQMKAASKSADNPFFKSKYADLAAVVDSIRKPFSDNELAYSQGIAAVDNGIEVTTLLFHTSGQWLESQLWLPVNKQDAQGFGSASTYGRRYGLQSIAGLPTDDDDGNAAADSVGKGTPRQAQANGEKPPKPAPDAATSKIAEALIATISKAGSIEELKSALAMAPDGFSRTPHYKKVVAAKDARKLALIRDEIDRVCTANNIDDVKAAMYASAQGIKDIAVMTAEQAGDLLDSICNDVEQSAGVA